ncbi:MAG: hypothetical protein AB1717_05690 [Pseudomonadota bacterium]
MLFYIDVREHRTFFIRPEHPQQKNLSFDPGASINSIKPVDASRESSKMQPCCSFACSMGEPDERLEPFSAAAGVTFANFQKRSAD